MAKKPIARTELLNRQKKGESYIGPIEFVAGTALCEFCEKEAVHCEVVMIRGLITNQIFGCKGHK